MIAEVILDSIEDYMDEVHTSIPGKIVSYDMDEQTASVQPSIKHVHIDEEGKRVAQNLPIINRVPVVFLRGSGGSITFPLSKGDRCAIFFSEAAIDKWTSGGGGSEVDPDDYRRFSIADAFCVPGLYPPKEATSEVDATALVVAATVLKLGSSTASESIVLGDTFLTALKTCLDAIAALTTNPTTAAAAVTALNTASSTYLSTKVKAEL